MTETEIQIIRQPIPRSRLRGMAREEFGGLVKTVVDIERRIMAVGGDMHADEEGVLLADGSPQKDLWGINLFPHKDNEKFIEFDSMINLRPSQGNRSRGVDDPATRSRIQKVVHTLIL